MATRAGRDDERQAGSGQQPQRGDVEVVEMGVRDEDAVERAERGEVDGAALPAQVGDAAAKDGVGEQPGAVELDEDGRVADVGDRVSG